MWPLLAARQLLPFTVHPAAAVAAAVCLFTLPLLCALSLLCPQSGDEECLAAWSRICAASRKEFQAIYDRLGVTLSERGESFYNPMLKGEGEG